MILCLNFGHIFENFTYWQNLGSDLMRITFLVIFALSVIIPIGVNDAFGAFVNDNTCNSLKHIPNNSWKLFLCSTVEINGDAPGITLTNDDRFGDSVANIAELELLIGIPAESVPTWVVNLATWVSEDKITTGDMIIAIEHIINN